MRLRGPLTAVAVAGAANAVPGLGVVGRVRIPGVLRSVPGPNVAVLTFDDGPHPAGTPAVLEALDQLGARATFFVMSAAAQQHATIIDDVVAAGHEIALHGARHLPHPLRWPAALVDELRRAQAVVEDLSGQPVRALRAPFGAAAVATVAHARRAGLVLAGWASWGRDWEARATPESICARVLGSLTPGGLVLLHDSDAYSAAGSWRRTVAALPTILEGIAEQGLRIVTLRDALESADARATRWEGGR